MVEHLPFLPPGATVLVADDAPGLMAAMRRVFKLEGAVTHTARSLAEALSGFNDCSPDLVISDIDGADVDGLSLIRRVRSRTVAEGGAVPALATTDSESSVEAALAAGYDEVLVRPFDLDDLYSHVRSLDIQIAEARPAYWQALRSARDHQLLRARLRERMAELEAQREAMRAQWDKKWYP